MKRLAAIPVVLLLSACATQEDANSRDTRQAIRDFIEVRELEPVRQIRTATDDQWQDIDESFVLYLKRHEAYLFEFWRPCQELYTYPVVADVRRSGNTISARADTLRGCRIENIYPLTEAEVVELRDIGESPGSRN